MRGAAYGPLPAGLRSRSAGLSDPRPIVSGMRFGVLGPLAVWTAGGAVVTVPGLKVRALLADLLVHLGQPVSADRLVEDLWGDEAPGNPGGALQAKVSQLRRALEEAEPGARELVRSGPPGYLLRAGPAEVDAARFAELAQRARAAVDARTRAALLADALALWRGPPFADFADHPFAAAAVARLEEQRLVALEEQAEARLALGEHSSLAGELAELVARHPLRERLRAAQLRALYRAGRQSEALASYAALREQLADELGLDPSPELVALHRAILTQDPALAAPPSPAPAPASTVSPVSAQPAGFEPSGAPDGGRSGMDGGAVARPRSNLPVPLTGLVGRTTAVADVRALLGAGRLVTLIGPGGVGKTRLAVAVASELVSTFADGAWLVDLAALGPPSVRAGPPAVTTTSGPAGENSGASQDGAGGRDAEAGRGGHDTGRGGHDTGRGGHDTGRGGQDTGRGGQDTGAGAGGGQDATAAMAGALAEAAMAVLGIRDTATANRRAGGGAATPVEQLCAALRTRRLLLVLDSCEHVVEAVAELAARLLPAAPGLRLLATSREPLGLAGEALWPVPPLDLPDLTAQARPSDVAGFSAVRLFVERATAAAPAFTLDATNAKAVVQLCRRLDGLPLAMELAATRVRALGVDGILARLDDRFRLLATGYRGAPPRQQTLRAMIDWSWELLTEPERAVLRRLAVHADGCTLDAAEAVCAGDGVPAHDVLDLLARLVDRCMVAVIEHPGDRAGHGGTRYRLLESVADYCRQRLVEAGEQQRVRHRHLRYYLELAERATPLLRGPDQRAWLRRLDRDGANLRVALDGAVRAGHPELALRLANAMAWYWFLRGRLREAQRSLTTALTTTTATNADTAEVAADGSTGHPATMAPRATAAAWLAGLGLLAGDSTDPAGGDAALALFDGAGDPGALATAQWFLGFALSDFGDLSRSEELVRSALDAFRATGDRWGEAAALSTRTKQAMIRGDLAAVRECGGRSHALFVELGDRWGQLQATEWLGELAEVSGDYPLATELHTEGLRMAEELGLWPQASDRLSWLGRCALLAGDHRLAREHLERARRLATEQSYKPGEVFARMGQGFLARRQGRLDEAEEHLRAVLGWSRQAGFELGVAGALTLAELGFAAEQRGDPAAARRLHLDGLAVARGLGDPRAVALALEGLAGADALAGHPDHAAVLLGAAAAARESVGAPLPPAERGDIDRAMGLARHAVGEEAFAAGFDRGRSLAPDAALAHVGVGQVTS